MLSGKVLQRHFICQASSIEQFARKTLAKQEGGAPAKKPRIPPLTMPADPQNHVFLSVPGCQAATRKLFADDVSCEFFPSWAGVDVRPFAQVLDGARFDVSVNAGVGTTH